MEVFRLNPDEEEFINDYESDDNCDLQEWERIEKILKKRYPQLFTDGEMLDYRYTYLLCDEFPIYEYDFEEPVYVIK